MKAIRNILFSFVILPACTAPKFYHPRINDIPTSYPNYNTEILFVEDSLPKQPYFEVIDFDLLEPGILNKNEIRQRLEIEAIKEGVDAIIQVETNNEKLAKGNFLTLMIDIMDEDTETTTVMSNFTHITGRGIMYLENLDFIVNLPEFEYFYKVDQKTGFPTPFFKIEYKLTGQEYMVYPEADEALEIYKKYFQFYSDFHLVKQSEGWSYQTKDTQLKYRILWDQNGLMIKKCKLKYNDQNKLTEIRILHINDNTNQNEVIHYSYNSENGLANRLLEIQNGIKIYETYLYENGQLTGKRILINESPGQQILLQSSIHNYNPNYLKDYYFREVVKQKDKNQ